MDRLKCGDYLICENADKSAEIYISLTGGTEKKGTNMRSDLIG